MHDPRKTTDVSEALVLRLPNERHLLATVRLVVGGLGAQVKLSYDEVDDLQLAVETALSRTIGAGDAVTLRLARSGEGVEVLIGPIDERGIDRTDAPGADGSELPSSRILSMLVDVVEFVVFEDERWLRLEKQVPAQREPAR